MNLFFFNIPVNCIFTMSKINMWNSIYLLTTENSNKFAFIRHNRTIKNTCNIFNWISINNWVLIVSPYRCIF